MGRSPSYGASRRRGAVTLELILTLPVIVVLLVAIFEYGTIMVLQAAVTHAATVGAREAGKCSDVSLVARVVQSVVGVNCITISDVPGSGTKVVLEDGTEGVSVFGDPNLNCQLPTNPLNPDEVRVTVCVALSAAPVCDPLGDFGFSLLGCQFQVSSLVKKEVFPETETLPEN
jgi:hypothetical protein